MNYLGTYEITNDNGTIDNVNIINFLRNTENHTDDGNIYYSKLGNIYFIQGILTFDELIMDVLPEEALTNSFITTSTGEIIQIEKNKTTLTAPSTGTKTISGFYFTDNGENRND